MGGGRGVALSRGQEVCRLSMQIILCKTFYVTKLHLPLQGLGDRQDMNRSSSGCPNVQESSEGTAPHPHPEHAVKLAFTMNFLVELQQSALRINQVGFG